MGRMMEQRLVREIAVNYAGQSWRVRRPLGPDAILLYNGQGEVISADPTKISFPNDGKIFSDRIRAEQCFSGAQWAEAQRRREIVILLGGNENRTRARMDEASKELGISRRRLWEILRETEPSGFEITAFLPKSRGPRKKRLANAIEAIIYQSMDKHYARPSGVTLQSLLNEIEGRCRAAGLSPPSYRTVKSRASDRDQIWLTRRREGSKAARALRLLTGSHPGASAPWERVQTDSTKCDVRLVRASDRTVIGRATGTFAIDIYSRATLGFSCSLEGASTLTVATCLEHAFLPKDDWLARRNLQHLYWPVYGKPVVFEYDRGPENEARGIQRGLKLHGIKSKVRAKGHPEHHGHIERLIGTIMKKLHELPGSTFSNSNTGKTRGDRALCWFLAASDKVWQRWDPRVAGNCETTAEIIPKRQAKLGACFAQSEEGITTVAAGLWTSLSACTQHNACKPMLNWPASSLSRTVSCRNSCA